MSTCTGTTKEGLSCRNRAVDGSDRCRLHGGYRRTLIAPADQRAAIESEAFKKAQREAEEIAKDPKRTRPLLREAQAHAAGLGASGAFSGWIDDLTTLIRLVQAWTDGRYKRVPWATIVAAVAAIIYFVNPADLIPDVIPLVGYVDDGVVIAWVVESIRADLDSFRRWERGDDA